MKSIDPDERAKILKLQNELQNGDNKKVEWLYGGEKIDREAYLLGKPIDKLITESEKNEAASKHAKFTSTVDLANKIREDPLFEIKKMEIESKKRLLENPMKMRQLKELISQRSHDSEENKKHDKSRRRRKSRSSNEGSSDDDDDEIKKRKRNKDDHYGYHRVKHEEDTRRNDVRRNEKSESRREAEKYKKRIEDLKKIRESIPSSNSRDERDRKQVKKMSEEEKRLKLEKMSENAKWRDGVRNKNVSKCKHDDRKEEEEERGGSRSAASSEIFNSMMRDGNSSIEDRIKRNVKNIQKKDSSYDSNFARR